jgi:hypothetical protein
MTDFDPKAIHMLRCHVCNGYHRIKITLVGEALNAEEMPPPEMLFPCGPTKCPKTGKSFDVTEDDWLHLTEEEYHARFPGNHSN